MAVHGRFLMDVSLAQALASGATVAEAARQAGIGERTAYRRLTNPAFRRRVAQIQHAMARRALGRMTEGMSLAAEKLLQLMNTEDHRIQLRAARTLLDLGPRLRDSVELEARLVDLEQQRAEEGGKTP